MKKSPKKPTLEDLLKDTEELLNYVNNLNDLIIDYFSHKSVINIGNIH